MPDANGTFTLLGNASTGTGSVVLATSPTLVTPVLGVATVTSINGLTITTSTGTLTLANGSTLATSGANSITLTSTGATNVTLPTTGTLTSTANNLSAFAATTSAQLAGVISDETGTGVVVLATSPTLVTPVLGVATGTSLATSAQNIFSAVAATAPVVARSTTATDDDIRLLPFAGGVGRFAGIITTADLTADRTYTFPNVSGTFTTTADNLSVFAATTSAQLSGVISDETGTGVVVLATGPSFVGLTSTGVVTLTGAEIAGASPLVLEGLTVDTNETTLAVTDPTADRTITFPDLSGTVTLLGNTTTGSGSIVLATSPTLVTPVLGVATATSINGLTITTTTGTLTLANGSTLVTSGANSITLTSTGATNVTLPTTGTLATLAGIETLTNKTLTAPAVNSFTTSSQTFSAAGTDDTTAEWTGENVLRLTAAGTQTVNLGACASNANKVVTIRVVDTSVNARTINGTNTEGIVPLPAEPRPTLR